MRKYLFTVASIVVGVALAAGAANDPFSKSQGVIDVAVYGDAPYGTTPTDTSETVATPAFIDAVNAADPQFIVHVGDIHSGKQFCTSDYDQQIYQLWTAYQRPLVYTPGDNEWTDCNKAGEGGGAYNKATKMIDYVVDAQGNFVDYAKGDPIQNLTLIRSLFFSDPGHALGAARKLVLSQAQAFDPAHPSDAQFVENVMWEQSNVLFVTLNIPGGSNNDQDVWYVAPTLSLPQIKEIAERTDADIRWLDAAFARASKDGVVGVVIIIQADMWDPEKGPAHQLGFEGSFGFDDSTYKFDHTKPDPSRDIVGDIAKHVSSFGGTVLLFNGDSHLFRSDNPLMPISDASPCIIEAGPTTVTNCAKNTQDVGDYAQHANGYKNVSNFHRVVVHGSTFPLEWLKLTINPRAHAPAGPYAIGPFSWQRMPQQ
jgi:hypothetical protein